MSAAGIAWRRVNLGLYLVGFGTVLLLTSTGGLPRTLWLDAAAFWPMALVALGIRLLFERSQLPALVLLSPALVLGTLGYVALRPPLPHHGEWRALHAERPSDLQRWTFGARLARAELDVSTRDLGAGSLVSGRASCERGRGELRVRERRGRHRIEARADHRFWRATSDRERWELDLGRQLPMSVDLGLAFATGQLDLAQARLERLELSGAFNDLAILLPAPTEDVELKVGGVSNRVVLLVPESTPVRTRTDGALLRIEGQDELESGAGPGYRLTLDGLSNTVNLRKAPPSPARSAPGR